MGDLDVFYDSEAHDEPMDHFSECEDEDSTPLPDASLPGKSMPPNDPPPRISDTRTTVLPPTPLEGHGVIMILFARSVLFLQAMMTAGFKPPGNRGGLFDYYDHTQPAPTFQVDQNLLIPSVEQRLCEIIDDPLGPDIFHFDPPARYFDPLSRLGRPASGHRPVAALDGKHEADTCQMAAITARLITRIRARRKIFTLSAPYPSLI